VNSFYKFKALQLPKVVFRNTKNVQLALEDENYLVQWVKKKDILKANSAGTFFSFPILVSSPSMYSFALGFSQRALKSPLIPCS